MAMRGRDKAGAYPVLGRLSNKRILATTSTRVALDRVSSSPNEIVKLGELDDDRIVVVSTRRQKRQGGNG
jgi:hypothetical protein